MLSYLASMLRFDSPENVRFDFITPLNKVIRFRGAVKIKL